MSTKSERDAAEAERARVARSKGDAARNAKHITKDEYARLTADQRDAWVLDNKAGDFVEKPDVAHDVPKTGATRDSQASIDQSRIEREARRSP